MAARLCINYLDFNSIASTHLHISLGLELPFMFYRIAFGFLVAVRKSFVTGISKYVPLYSTFFMLNSMLP